MNLSLFWELLEARINQHHLLCHPFYKAWSAGELSREDLREYASDYYHHVAAFPAYLSALHARLEDGNVRRAVLHNLCDEEGIGSPDSRSHAELWLDFAEGMGAKREAVCRRSPVKEINDLISTFRSLVSQRSTAAALACLYAYESRVPRIAQEKARGLRERYGADALTCGYFNLHKTADVRHARTWRDLLETVLADQPELTEDALSAADQVAQALWQALDAIERQRLSRTVN